MFKLATATALAAVLTLPAAASGAHNGTWAVELVTESGPCSVRTSYAVAIREGQVRLASGGADVSGTVAADGSVGLSVSNGVARGTGSGRLRAGGGSGTWKVSSLCTGRWTARRDVDRTAQAE